jgi:hypothetical protein
MLSIIQTHSSSFGLRPFCYRKTLTHYVSEAGCASVFRLEAPNLLDSLDHTQILMRVNGMCDWLASFYKHEESGLIFKPDVCCPSACI